MLRRILSTLLTLCFLGPSGLPLLGAALNPDSMRGMACCRKTKHGCCKRKQHSQGPAWQAARACKDKCSAAPLAFGSSKPASLPLHIEPAPALRVYRFAVIERTILARHRETHLHQRPPPASSC